jgi:hypothetical protein
MSKQTAVEWFFDKIKSHFEHDGDLFETACITYAIAKEKEKEQIIEANRDGADMVMLKKNFVTGEAYYNETYGGDK